MQELHTKVLLLFHFRSCDGAAAGALEAHFFAGTRGAATVHASASTLASLLPSYAGGGQSSPVRESRRRISWGQGLEHHQTGNIINLFGIESPGLAASLAIAENVASRVKRGWPSIGSRIAWELRSDSISGRVERGSVADVPAIDAEFLS